MKNKKYPYYDVLEDISDLKDLILTKASDSPDKIAFVYPCETGEMRKTYHDLKEDINAFGTWMYKNKIKDKHVAIIGKNSYEWLVSFLACVNGGNVAVAIDKSLPANEISELLKLADVDCALVTDQYIEKVDTKIVKKVYDLGTFDTILYEGRKLLRDKNNDFLTYQIDPEKTAAILFTSGTSGKSKGVELTNKNIAFEINRTCQLYKPSGNVLAILPFHHAFGLIVGIFMAVNYEEAVYINKSPKYVKKNLQDFKPQTIFMVPMFVEFFHKQIWAEIDKKGKTAATKGLMASTDLLLKTGVDVRKKTYSAIHKVFGGNLEYIICGGAALDPMYVKEFRSWGIEILNGYGTTECSPCTAVNRPFHHKDGSVGVLIPDTEVRVSEEGEILFKGDHVMKGYYKDEEATNAAIIDGWYHTGDLGYVDEEGFITLTGRKKNLIILSNGENLSPEELEEDFLHDPAVKEVLVYDENGKIVAEIFPEEDYLDNQEYFNALKEKINNKRPMFKRIAVVKLRKEEFIKNGSMKIVRYLNIPKANSSEQ
ncbi:long-chain acyl-CoA synthetase [Lachnospiraceae bacterium G41]|nr:long-chain acyl-CoA synthetase [Lachnospiraceae bacterium G41]